MYTQKHLSISTQTDFIQGCGVRGGGAGQQRGDAAELLNQHHWINRGLGRSVSSRHESGLQTITQESGGAICWTREWGQTAADALSVRFNVSVTCRVSFSCHRRCCYRMWSIWPSADSSSCVSSLLRSSRLNCSSWGISTPIRARAERCYYWPRYDSQQQQQQQRRHRRRYE